MCGLQRAGGGAEAPEGGAGRGSPGQMFPGCSGGPAALVCWWPVHTSGFLEHPVALESNTEAK